MAAPQLAEAAPAGIAAWLKEAYDDALRRLSDFWFGMALLAIWGVMTLIGVIVDQEKDAAFYLTNYAPPLARLVLRLHLDDIYHSPAYVGMIGLIVACMTLATFKRVIPARMPPLYPIKLEAVPLSARLSVRGSLAETRARVERFFAERGWLVRKREHAGVEWTYADRHNWARRGVLIAHAGFVLIAAGTTIYWAAGYRGDVAILTGASATIPQNGARLELLRFGYRFDPVRTRGGTVYQPVDYVSTLRVTGRDGVAREETLRVNHPLDVDGTLYYQSSYGSAASFAIARNGRTVQTTASPLFEGDALPVGATSRSIRYARFVGTIDARGGIAPDPRPNAPGVLLEVLDGDQPIGEVLLPIGRPLALGAGYSVTATGYTLFSGIQYQHDPGIPLVLAGALVLLAGLCISVYLVPARFFVRVAPSAPGETEVALAATTVKGFDIFEEQFAALVEELRATTAEAPA